MTNLFTPTLRTPQPHRPGGRSVLAGLLCCATSWAHADTLDSQIAYHNDVIYHSIVIEETLNLVAWTDSYHDGENFDPIVAVWHDGNLLTIVDDDPSVAPGQTRYDSGLRLSGLTAGTYLFTITAYDNFANGTTLDGGFRLDQETPIPLADWCQPFSSCNMGPHVTLNWTVSAVPEPSAWLLFTAGGGLIGAAAWRRRRAG